MTFVDTVFWLLMLIFAQILMQIDTSSYLAPLLTIVFGFSFAIAPILSNLFLSLSFVLFMHPFDVGQKIIIGKGTETQLNGLVTSISLMYTTLSSRESERVSLPNHVLFFARIQNVSESKNITFVIPVSFCLFGPKGCPQVSIWFRVLYCLSWIALIHLLSFNN